MSLKNVLDCNNLLKPRRRLDFIKNEDGVLEQKIVEIPEEIGEEPERGIILIGHVGIGCISPVKTEIYRVLQEHNLPLYSLQEHGLGAILSDDSDRFLEYLCPKLFGEEIGEQIKNNNVLEIITLTMREEMTEVFLLIPNDLVDTRQRNLYHQNYSPKTQTKKGYYPKILKQKKI